MTEGWFFLKIFSLCFKTYWTGCVEKYVSEFAPCTVLEQTVQQLYIKLIDLTIFGETFI